MRPDAFFADELSFNGLNLNVQLSSLNKGLELWKSLSTHFFLVRLSPPRRPEAAQLREAARFT
jgi:hypothetical protein